jgi:hypothetical protein
VETFRDLTAIKNLQKALCKQSSFEDIISKIRENVQSFFDSATNPRKQQQGSDREDQQRGQRAY